MKIFGIPVIIDFSVDADLLAYLQEEAAIDDLADILEEMRDDGDLEGAKGIQSLLGAYGLVETDGSWSYGGEE